MKVLHWTAGGLAVLLLILAAVLSAERPRDCVVTYARTPQTTEMSVTSTGTAPVKAEQSALTRTTMTGAPTTVLLNEATGSDLMSVSGIGEVLADRILARRTALGGFATREELLSVEGIGDALADRILSRFSLPALQTPKKTEAPTAPVTTDGVQATSPAQSTMITTTVPRPYLEMNAATFEELLTIPGMTEELAQGFLELRTSIHAFSHPYEILLLHQVRAEASEAWLTSIVDCFYVEGVQDVRCTDPFY